VNGYINASSYADEWTELLVVDDDVNMAGWTIRDNNNTQSSWQTPVRFNNVSLWQHLRRGTVIMLWHRTLASNGVTTHPTDVNADDGYIEISLQNTTYFTGGDFSTNNTMNIAAEGDIVQIRNASNVHIHALGHYQSASGSSWTALSTPKLNHNTNTNAGDAIYVCPGSVLSDYNGPQGNTYTSRNNVTTTFGLPNICIASPSGNRTFWKNLRQPDFTSQSVVPSSIIPGMPGSLTFSWTAATDPYAADNTIGYIVLRNTTNSFPVAPIDGTTYTIGALLGGAQVVGIINNSTTTTFTDNSIMNGINYYYRVYPFRYGTDNLNGNNYDEARGRAYNENNFVFVDWPGNPLPIELLTFKANRNEKNIRVSWITHSETNNDYFILEKSYDGKSYSFLTKIKGAGTTTETNSYGYDDLSVNDGVVYYRLSQIDFDGSHSQYYYAHANSKAPVIEYKLSPNPFTDQLFLVMDYRNESTLTINFYDASGKKLLTSSYQITEGYNSIQMDAGSLSKGIYFYSISIDEKTYYGKLIKN
jgi:hypothetical protein